MNRTQHGRPSSPPVSLFGLPALVFVISWFSLTAHSQPKPTPQATEVSQPTTPLPSTQNKSNPDGSFLDGPKLAKALCASCHLFPEPDLLDKKTWRDGTLPRMKIRVGLLPSYIENHRESKLLKATGVFPTFPMISEAEWKAIEDYYLAAAPEKPLPQDPRPEIKMGLKLFAADRPKFKRPKPATTMVAINSKGRRIYMGDAETKSFDLLGSDGSLLSSVSVGNTPVALTETEEGFFLTMIGHFLPSEDPKGALIFLETTESGLRPPKTLLAGLPRATDTEFADLNGDGKMDFVISLFGSTVGRLSWFENVGGDNYSEHVLIPKAGAIRTVIRDFNGDRSPDIAVLVAQELETFFLLFNDGKGNFTTQPIFQKPPIYGHSYFEMADMDKDGRTDILVTNGDNGEYASPLKRYHGVRIYLNKGNNRFEESFFYPLNGAFKAVARDFDEDGDLDIAAVSFFPDYEKTPQESFVYLENQGGLKFAASTFEQFFTGRWLTMDAGDLDGDGDIDLALGSYSQGPTEVPEFFMNVWEKVGPSVLILRNKLR
ncbi:MAG: VCBS repeat-containing protein [Verrucomicrobia bacterium]|nr:VCBS repeat-containing protein [Verrucomicrobiota bacterium]